MSAGEPLFLREAEVAELLALDEAIDVLEAGLCDEGLGRVAALAKTHLALPGGGGLHALGAAGAGLAAAKVWTHAPGGATPLLALWSSETGELEALIEAFALGQLRTGAITGVATRRLARADAAELAQIGTGKQALAQVAAVAAVRPLRRIRVYSPTASHREAFAERLAAAGIGGEIRACSGPDEALDGAPIATIATRAREPFVRAAQLAAGAHLNAIGAITPERAELHQDVLARCAWIAVDALAAARELSRELIEYHGREPERWASVRELARLVARDERRPPDAELTLFKALGSGVGDLAIGRELLERARRAGAGRALPRAQRAALRLRREKETR